MMKSACLIIGIALLAGHAAAQEVKSNPDLFLQCSDYDNEREKLRARMDSAKSHASYMNDEKERLEAEIHEHERELNRLDEILKIMRNSDDVWDKRDREYDRYSRVFDEYNEFMAGFERSRANYGGYLDRSASLTSQLKSDCFGTWSGKTLGRFCDKGDGRVQQFCSRFN